ncbi:hypothetical protein QUF76_14350 [Desulfobacterales bacterium HSG16]|nr:hypothetical protein [Desulfobacterales bacterium HSG16]
MLLSFLCNNCHRAWRAGGKTLQPRRVSALIVPGNKKDTTYLPFWRIRAQVSGMILNTVADFVKAANLPKVITEDMTKDKFYFWSPAFRLDPDSFVRLGNLMTINQSAEVPENTLPDANAFSVTLPVKEAVESLKTTLSGFIKPKRIFYKRLPRMRIIPKRFMLVFIPFTDRPYELTHYKYPIAINKKMLTRMKSL